MSGGGPDAMNVVENARLPLRVVCVPHEGRVRDGVSNEFAVEWVQGVAEGIWLRYAPLPPVGLEENKGLRGCLAVDPRQ